MEYAGFSDTHLAIAHQRQHGGWFFVPEDNLQVILFALGYTPSKICTHPATRGMNGQITTRI